MYEYIYGCMLTNTIIIDEGEDRAMMEGRVSTGENIAISGRLHLADGPPDTRSSSRGRNAILPPVIIFFCFVFFFFSTYNQTNINDRFDLSRGRLILRVHPLLDRF